MRSHDRIILLLFLAYVVGDCLTTYAAISSGQGYEGNLFLSSWIGNNLSLNLAFLFGIKTLFILFIYKMGLLIEKTGYYKFWNCSGNAAVFFIGELCIVNNLIVLETG